MEWSSVAEWLFFGMMGGISWYGVHVLSRLQESVEKLNIQIAVVISKMSNHEKRISQLEKKK